MTSGAGLWDDMGKVKVTKRGQFLKPGEYRVKINAVKVQQSQAVGANKLWYIIEMTVLESDNLEIKVGNEYSQVLDMGNVMTKPNIKAFVAALSGVDPNSGNLDAEVEEYWRKKLLEMDPPLIEDTEVPSFGDICDIVVSDANPLQGEEARLTCFETLTKKEQKPFTVHVWKCL